MKKIKYGVMFLIIIILVVGSIISVYFLAKDVKFENNDDIVELEITTINVHEFDNANIETFKVDIKGAVVNPGVYELPVNSIVNDVINLAGGLTKNATTKNINLSQKIFDSMVIYIFTNQELTTQTTTFLSDVKCTTNVIEINNCITTTTTTKSIENNVNKLVNINTCSKEELMTLTGIGESKADAIIEYRNKNKFNSIEDIMNVSGIGESAFEKIKNNITV